MTQDSNYFQGLSKYAGEGWNRFWFKPSAAVDLCLLRVCIGVVALVWQLSYTTTLTTWFGPEGWFDAGVYHAWVGGESGATTGRFSYLFTQTAGGLWALHIVSSLVLIAFTVGFKTRVTSVLALLVVLSYIHRAPFITAQPEVVLSFIVGYLCLAPCGAVLSLDARGNPRDLADHQTSLTTIARRLIQVHLCAVYLFAFTTKLAAPTWWNGDAMWWYVAQSSVRSVDLTFLQTQPVLLNLWTFVTMMCDLMMVVLVWNRWLRPLVLGASTIHWIVLGIATGRFAFPLTMIVANLAFIGAETVQEWYRRPVRS